MNKITIKNYEKIKGGYAVKLGNNTTTTFTNLISTKAFLAETSRFLTDRMFALNEIYTQTLIVYRAAWLLDEKYCNCLAIKDALQAVDELLTASYYKSHYKDGHLLSFINLIKSIEFMKRALKKAKIPFERRSETYTLYKIDNLFIMLAANKVQLENYAKMPELVDREQTMMVGKEVNVFSVYA